MRYILWIIVLTSLLSCAKKDYKKFQVPENAAMSPLWIPVYEDLTHITTDRALTILAPETQVYFTDDSLNINGVIYTVITWGDSSAYAQADLLLPGGHHVWAIEPKRYQGINIYSDERLKTVIDRDGVDMMPFMIGKPRGNAAPTIYRLNDEAVRGFLDTHYITTDSMVFIKRRARVAAGLDYEENEVFNNAAYGNPGFTKYQLAARENDWLIDNRAIPDQHPGIIRKYFVMEDSTEKEVTRDYQLIDGHVAGNSGVFEKIVTGIRFEVTLYKPAKLRFEVNTYYDDESGYNTQFVKDFGNVKAYIPYSVIVGNTRENSMILCSIVRAVVTAGGATATATVSGDCSD